MSQFSMVEKLQAEIEFMSFECPNLQKKTKVQHLHSAHFSYCILSTISLGQNEWHTQMNKNSKKLAFV